MVSIIEYCYQEEITFTCYQRYSSVHSTSVHNKPNIYYIFCLQKTSETFGMTKSLSICLIENIIPCLLLWWLINLNYI